MEDEIFIRQKLSPLEVRVQLKGLEDWAVQDDRLVKEYLFPDFARAMVFVNQMMNPIEEYQNYPQIHMAYNRVTVSLFTPTVGAISNLDIQMAKEFDQIFRQA